MKSNNIFEKYSINLKVVGILIVVIAIVGVGGFFLYRFQSQKLVVAYRTQAERAKSDGNLEKERSYLNRYLALNPTDTQARVRFGMLQARFARNTNEKNQAYLTLQEALRADPTLPLEVRVQCVRLTMHPLVADYLGARRELDYLLEKDPKNADYLELYGDTFVFSRSFKEADSYYGRALLIDPKRVITYTKQEALRRQLMQKPADAENTVKDMLKVNNDSALAHLTAATHYRALGKYDETIVHIEQAQKLAPTNPDVVLASSELLVGRGQQDMRLGKLEEGKAKINSAIENVKKMIEVTIPKMPALDPPPEMDSPEERLIDLVMRGFRLLLAMLEREELFAEGEKWARKQVEMFPGSTSVRYELVDTLVSAKKYEEAEKAILELDRAGYSAPMLDYQRGRIAANREQWIEANRYLQQTLDTLNNPEIVRRGAALLARGYAMTGELDRRYDAYRRAIPQDPFEPGWAAAKLGLVETLTALGRTPEAIDELRSMTKLLPYANTPLARLLIGELLTKPLDQRRFDEVNEVVAKITPPSPELELLKAQLAVAKGDIPGANQILQTATDKTPDSFDLWQARVLLALSERQLAKVDELTTAIDKRFGDRLEARLLKLRLLYSRGRPSEEQLKKLAEPSEKITGMQRAVLMKELSVAAVRGQYLELAKGWLVEVSKERPLDLDVQMQLYDFAVITNDQIGKQAAIDQVIKTTGDPDSMPSRVVRAFDMLDRAQDRTTAKVVNPQALEEAGNILSGVERQRNTWGRLYIALGRVADLKEDYSAAARHYQRALDLGERNPRIIDRLLSMYTTLNQGAEADRLMKAYPEAGMSMSLEARAEVMVRTKNFAEAGRLAEKAVPIDSKDVNKLLWQSRIFVLASRVDNAIKVLERVTTIAPDQPEGWVARVQQLAATKRVSEAEKLIEEARKKIRPQDAELAAAQCAEIVGRIDLARKLYDDLLTKRQDTQVLKVVGSFKFRNGDIAGARKIFETILQREKDSKTLSKEDLEFAKRILALTLANNRDPREAMKSLEVLGLTADGVAQNLNDLSVEDLRTRGVILSVLPGRKNKISALRMFETLETKSALNAEDQLVFGQTYLKLQDWGKAKTRMVNSASAVDAPKNAASILVLAMLQNNEIAEARGWLDRAMKADPYNPGTLELQSKLANAEGKPEEAVKLVESAVSKAGRPELAGPILERLNIYDAAEAAFRRSAGSGKWDNQLGLAAFLGRRGRVTDAIEAYKPAIANAPPVYVATTVCQTVIDSMGRATPEQFALMGKWVEDAAAKDPQQIVYLAAVKSVVGDYDAAIRMSRQVLASKPDNVIALNNLAYLLAMKENQIEEAKKYIDQAIQLYGPSPTLLDTKALILMQDKNPGAAADLLDEAVVDEPTSVIYTHLAMAHLEANRRSDAQAAFINAKRRNMRDGEFHPLEWPRIKRLREEFDKN